MKFVLLMYDNVKAWRDADDAGKAAIGAQHSAFSDALKERGRWVGGLGAEATTVRKQNGDAIVTDGPHSESVDQLGGFYIVEAEDLAEAVELARDIPAPTVEVRPIAEA